MRLIAAVLGALVGLASPAQAVQIINVAGTFGGPAGPFTHSFDANITLNHARYYPGVPAQTVYAGVGTLILDGNTYGIKRALLDTDSDQRILDVNLYFGDLGDLFLSFRDVDASEGIPSSFYWTLSHSAQNGFVGSDGHQVTINTLTTVSTQISGEPLVPQIPEPTSWTTMVAGFASIGAAMRYRRRPRGSLA